MTALEPAADGKPNHYLAPDYDTLVDSPIVAGDPVVHEFEVDGSQHAESGRDVARDQWLTEHRYRVLRFWNNEVLENIEGVWDTIFAAASAAAPPHPDPLPARGEREESSTAAE